MTLLTDAPQKADGAKQRPRCVRWLMLALSASFGWPLQSLAADSYHAQTLTPAGAPVPAAADPLPTGPATPAAAIAAPLPSAKTGARERPAQLSPSAEQAAGTLRLSRSVPNSNPTLDRAYAGLQTGRLDAARRDYEAVLRSDTKNTDALLGLATIAARRGQTERAQRYYLRALESDPTDPSAQAGLISTRGQADPGFAESRLKSALTGQPESAALHFALGNVYARQNRWSEAQQAYFRAYAADPDNADVIFNLAVSLDHLHQNQLAAQYYRMALDDSRLPHRSFDENQVRQRILELLP